MLTLEHPQIIICFLFITLSLSFQLTPIQQYEQFKTGSDCSIGCCMSLPDRPPMTYTFFQKTGKFIGGSGEYRIESYAYSGLGKYVNDPTQQCAEHDVGPLPASTYKLGYCKDIMHEKNQRPCSFYLDPQKPEEICGRKDFFIHGCACCTSGDDTQPPTLGCSQGCVILNYENRKKLQLGDLLIVKHQEAKVEEQQLN